MIPVLTAADVKRQDAEAEARGIPVDQLMRAAGAAVAYGAMRLLEPVYGSHVVVVCGKGNNGGDGMVAARFLSRRGARVTVCLAAGDPTGAAARALRAFDGPVIRIDALPAALAETDLAVDALLGVGLSRAPDGALASAIAALNDSGSPILSVDVPSGLDADTGAVPGDAVRADATITLGGLKPGLLFALGAALAGDVRVADIGMPVDLRDGTAFALEETDVTMALPERAPDANKYRSGVVLAVCGSRGMPGAAALVSAAAARSGAGLVMLASHRSVCTVAVGRTPEIVTVPLGDSPDGVVDEKGLELIRERLPKASALVIGPGLTRHPAAAEAVRALALEATVPLVLDADGLNAFESDAAALGARRAPTVLTPHEGEFERLTGAAVVDRMRDTRSLARSTGCVVLLKGAGTVVAAPDGRTALNATGGPSLASAGTGDVLAGVIAALLARGLDAFDAASVGAFVHGTAADALAGSTPSAGDVLDALPEVFEYLEAL